VESRWLGTVTVVSTLAQSYMDRAASGVGMVAELAAEQKLMKDSNLPTNLIYQPTAMTIKKLAAFSSLSSDFISALGHKISSVSGKERNFILVPASGIATTQCSTSVRHLHVPGRSGPIAIAALFLLFLTFEKK